MNTFHRNLNGGDHKWSVVVSGKANKCFSIYACDVTVKQPSGKKFDSCIAGGKRGVFAWFKSESVQPDFQPDIPSNALRVFLTRKRAILILRHRTAYVSTMRVKSGVPIQGNVMRLDDSLYLDFTLESNSLVNWTHFWISICENTALENILL